MDYDFEPRRMTAKEYSEDTWRRTKASLFGLFSGLAGGIAAENLVKGQINTPEEMGVTAAFAAVSLGALILGSKKSAMSAPVAMVAGVLLKLWMSCAPELTGNNYPSHQPTSAMVRALDEMPRDRPEFPPIHHHR